MKQQSKRHRLNQNIALIVVFLIGLTILLYPQISRIYYTIESNNQSKQFDREKSTLHQEDISQRIVLQRHLMPVCMM